LLLDEEELMLKAAWSGGVGTTGGALDAGRGLAILAVFYGHALAPWFMHGEAFFSEAAYMQWRFGASFMMPFFFFVSGLAWRADKSLWATLRESMTLVLIAIGASVAYDLLLFAITKGGWDALFAQDPLYGRMMLADIGRSILLGDHYALSALWFLTVLAAVRMMAAICHRLGAWSALAMFAILFVGFLVLMATYVPNFYQARQLWVGFGAFVLGHWTRSGFETLRQRLASILLIALAAGALTIATFQLNQGCPFNFASQCGLNFLGGRFGVSMYASLYGFLPLFVFTAITGTIMATALAVLMARYGGPIGVLLRRMGRNSLNLLIANALILEFINPLIVREIVPRLGAPTPLFFVVLVIVTIVVNLALAGLLRPALTRLRSLSRAFAMFVVEGLRGLAMRGPKRLATDASSQA
jgi:fucose 4-O-acetylase-like acetyltransferase